MRLRLLRRRLTISAPRMSVRSALPWPLRWLLAAVVLGFSGAVALWAFELGRGLAGLDGGAREQLARLQVEHRASQDELARLKAVANTADSLLLAERSTQEQLARQLKTLEAENRQLRTDLDFFEQLIPAAGEVGGVGVRALRAVRRTDARVQWQLLLMQAQRDPTLFEGEVEMTLEGVLGGRPWRLKAPPQAVSLLQHLRLDGQIEVPAQVALKTITVRLLQAGVVKATQAQRVVSL